MELALADRTFRENLKRFMLAGGKQFVYTSDYIQILIMKKTRLQLKEGRVSDFLNAFRHIVFLATNHGTTNKRSLSTFISSICLVI